MEFRVLGPLEVIHGGELIDLGPHKQRSLLVLLLINANRVVTTDRILEELWGEDADGKENALWVHVSRLRSVLEPDRAERGESTVLLTRDHGYVLSVDPESIDMHQFEVAVSEGRSLAKDDPAAASDVLGKALGLWRGAALEDFAYDDLAQTEIARLEELRLAALEARIEADLRSGESGALVGELEALQQQHPMQERFLALLMLALYRSGRQAEALRTFERFRRHIGEELGIEPSPELCRLEEQILLHDSRLQARVRGGSRKHAAMRGTETNPFKGLRAFQEDDNSSFFGRDLLVAEIVRRLDSGERLIGLIGPSGSGKSSVVEAGLIPALRKGAVPGSEDWLVAQMVPGSHPFAEVEMALLRSSLDSPDSLMNQLATPDTGILRAAMRVLPSKQSRMLLVIDQFEELFTLVDDEDRRTRFLTNLLTALDDPHGRVTVVLTLRADFYDRPLSYPAFGSRLGQGVVNVVPLRPEELEAAAQGPAERAGVSIEPALVAALLTDVVGQPGALPLFQYTLTELFDRRVGDTLTLDVYRSLDGVRGSLTKRADDLFAQLGPNESAVAKQLFLRLVTITDADDWGRRRVPASEVLALDVDVGALQEVVDLYAAHRLLTLDRDSVTGSPTVEVAHEALLTEWDRLREWIEQSRDDVRRHAALTTAMSEWHQADRDPGYLLSGSRLDGYGQWAATATMQLTSDEHEYLNAALAVRQQSRDAEAERTAHEQRVARSAKRRLWGLAAAVVVLASVVIGVVMNAIDSPTTVAVVSPSVFEGTGIGGLLEDGLDLSGKDFDIEPVLLSPPFTDLQGDLRRLAGDGLDLVIYWAPDFGREVAAVAAEYPDTEWIGLEGGSTVDFAVEEGAFLVGAAAALTSESNVIGFLGGVQIESIERFRAGYQAGAVAVRPDIEVISLYVGGVADYGFLADGFAREGAADLYQAGADVVFHAAGEAGRGLFDAAQQQSGLLGKDVWAIGVDSDQYWEVPASQQGFVLTSMIKRFDQVVYEVIATYEQVGSVDGDLLFTMREDAFDYSPTGGFLSDDTILELDRLKAEIRAGDRVVGSLPPIALRPPADAFEIVDVSVVHDGLQCAYEGPSVIPQGTTLRVDFRNDSADLAELTLARDDHPFFDMQIQAAVAQSMTGYVTIVGGDYLFGCNTTIGGGANAVNGDGFVVGPPTTARETISVTVADQCTIDESLQLVAGETVAFAVEMEADIGGGLNLLLLKPGVSIEQFRLDPFGSSSYYGSVHLEAGETAQRVVTLRPGTWLVDCWWADGSRSDNAQLLVTDQPPG